MFLDLLLRNSNELSSSHKKIQSKSDIKAVSSTGGKDDDDDDDEEEQQQKKQENINYSYNLNPTMAVNINKNPKIQQKLEYINDVLSKRTPSLEQQMNLARRACWCNGKADRQAMDQNVGWHRERDKERKCCENCFNDENATKMVLNGATNKSKLNNINDEADADNNIEDNNNKTDDDSKFNDSARVNLNNPITMNSSKFSENNLSKRKTTVATIKNSENCVNSENSEQVHMNNPNKSVNMNSNTINNETQNELENSNNLTDQLLEYIRIQLINLWLTFVAFCDKNTIKSNDPRFEMYRQREQQQREEKLQQQQQQQQASTSTNASTAKKSGQFKLLTSKKVIFLLLVCFFFTFINRIEARPNTNAPELIAAPASATSAIATEKSDFVQQPPHDATKLTPSVPISSSSDNHDDVNAHADEEHGDHPKRYPLSQIEFDRVKTPFIIGIWILSASIAKIGFHMTPKLHLIFPESCLLIVVGVVIGIILMYCTDVAVSPLTPNTFFFYMLPPIILDAGYFMPNRLFFDNLGTILLMAGVGTIFNIATIGGSLWACGQSGIFGNNTPEFLDIFLFASLISAVDPVAVLAVFEEIHVNEILYIVVFGESLLNDAVTVVMYHMMEVYDHIGIDNMIAQDVVSGIGSFFVVAVGGTVIGIIWGFLTGLVTRFTDHVRVIEPIFIFVMAYLAYLNAEIFHMSGILAITFCGITMKNYVESNISQKSHTTVKYALKMLSSSSETIIFMFLGVATVNNDHVWNTWFVILTILFCSVFRVIGVIILTAMANRFRLHKLSRVDQFVMSYGGLRGAVAFALVLLIDENLVPQKNMFVTTTIAVIYFTVFLQGITIKPLVKILNVKRASKRKPTMNERIHERFMDHLMAGIEDIVGKTGNYNVRDKFKRFDNRFIRPLLIRDLKGAEPKIIETYSKLTMRDAIEVMRRNPSTIGQISGTESMSALFRNYTNNCIGGSPSLTNLDNTCSRNLDMHELDYNPSKKDLTDAKIHHLLAEELKPYRRHRRLSYSRHAVDDRDLSTQVNYKMQMNFRRMFNDRKHHKRSKRGASKHQEGVKQNHVSFHDFQQNGTTKQFSHDQYINDVLNETAEERQQPSKLTEVTVQPDDWEEGLTFTAKSSPDSDRANNNSLIAHIQNLPGFDTSKARIVQHYATPTTGSSVVAASAGEASTSATSTAGNAANGGYTLTGILKNNAGGTTAAAGTSTTTINVSGVGEVSPDLLSPDAQIGPTAAELILPWRRDRSYQSFVPENAIPEEDRTISRDSDGERRVATPTATESQLPWKRQGDELTDAVQQNEFPAWASNKEYLAYNSPSATFLGGINKPKQPMSVIGLFRRESSGSRGGVSLGAADGLDSAGSARGSDPALAAALSGMVVVPSHPHNPRLDKRSQSISSGTTYGADHAAGGGHAGPFPVTASHRRNVRRGSMLELSGDIIPEESYHHGYSKSLCEPQGEEWESVLADAERNSTSTNSEKLLRGNERASGREPLLARLTPRAQIRRGMMGMGSGSGSGNISGLVGAKKNPVTTALLSSHHSDYEDEDEDDDDEEEDFDLYDDENIVVTTTTTEVPSTSSSALRKRFGIDDSNDQPPTTQTTTTIRLTRNNDESII